MAPGIPSRGLGTVGKTRAEVTRARPGKRGWDPRTEGARRGAGQERRVHVRCQGGAYTGRMFTTVPDQAMLPPCAWARALGTRRVLGVESVAL
jgi:hypothetical protein